MSDSPKNLTKIRVYVDRNTAILKGSAEHGLLVVECKPFDLTEEERKLLGYFPAWSRNGSAGPCADFCLDLHARDEAGRAIDPWPPKTVTVASLETVKVVLGQFKDVLAAHKALCEEREKAAAAKEQERREEGLRLQGLEQQKIDAWMAETKGWEDFSLEQMEGAFAHRPNISACSEWADFWTRVHELRAAVENAHAAQAERKREEVKAAKEQAAKEQAAWIKAHGSVRLKRHLKEGIDYGNIYREEWLAKEHPGWVADIFSRFRTSPPRAVPEEAFEMLDEARKSIPEAKLVYVTNRVLPKGFGWSCQAEIDGYSVYYGYLPNSPSMYSHITRNRNRNWTTDIAPLIDQAL